MMRFSPSRYDLKHGPFPFTTSLDQLPGIPPRRRWLRALHKPGGEDPAMRAGRQQQIFELPYMLFQRTNPGKICKIRGLAYTCKVTPSIASRMIDSAKETLRGYLSDVYI